MIAATPPALTSPDPYAIFAHARHVWMLQHYPRTLSYTVVMRGTAGGEVIVRHYSAQANTRTANVVADPVSEEQRDHPHVPRGVNFNIMLGPIPVPVNAEHSKDDPLGVPLLAPNYSFGMGPTVIDRTNNDRDLIAAIRSKYPSSQTAIIPNSLPQIGEVNSARRDYEIELVGTEIVRGADAYHLKLRPLRQPKRYRLRDVWIHTTKFWVQRLASAGNFDRGAATRARWDVDFTQIEGLQFIAGEHAEGLLRYKDDPFGITGHLVDSESVSFESIQMSERTFLEVPPINRDLDFVQEPIY